MPRTKKEKEVAQEEVVEEKVAKKVKEVSVYDGTILIRTYSEAVHGKDFAKLAENFISDRPNLTIK